MIADALVLEKQMNDDRLFISPQADRMDVRRLDRGVSVLMRFRPSMSYSSLGSVRNSNHVI